MDSEDEIRITKEILMDYRTKNGAWTKSQLDVLGVKWPPKKGWHDEVIGLKLTDDEFQKFIDGKNVFVKKENKKNGHH